MPGKKYKGTLAYVVRSLIKRFFKDEVSKTGAALAYFSLFSLFPFLIFVSMLIATFRIDPAFIDDFANVIPADILNLAKDYLAYINGIQSKTLMITGLFLTLYFSSRAVNALTQAVNRAYRSKRRHSGFRDLFISCVFTILMMVSMILILALMIFGKNVLLWLINFAEIPFMSKEFVYIWDFLRYLIVAAYSLFLVTCIYYIVPNKRLPLRAVFPGAVCSMLVWLMLSAGFSYYVQNMGNYSLLYGSLGAVMMLMFWLYWTGAILVMGAELNHIILTLDVTRGKG